MPTPAFLAIEFSDAVLEAVRASWETSRIRSRFRRAFERSGSAGLRSTPSSLIDVVRLWAALVNRITLRYSGQRTGELSVRRSLRLEVDHTSNSEGNVHMELGLHVSDFTWRGGVPALAPTLVRIAHDAEDAGF